MDQYLYHVRNFMMKDLSLPGSLMNNESAVKMLTFLFPCTENKTLKKLGYSVKGSLFVSIFRENNYSGREKFFS